MNKILLSIIFLIPNLCFADSKISQLPADTSPQSSDVVPAVQNSSSSNVKIALSDLKTFFGGGGSGNVGIGTPNQEAVYIGTTNVGSGIITDTGTNIGIGSPNPSATLDVEGTVGVFLNSGNVGIGTTKTTRGLVLYTPLSGTARFISQAPYSSNNGTNIFSLVSDNGTPITAGTKFTTLNFEGATDSAHTIGDAAGFTLYATQDWSGSAVGSRIDIETAQNNSASRNTRVTIANGNLGIGTYILPSSFDVIGNASIGNAANTSIAAPSNGLYVQGNVGVGSLTPGMKLDVTGTIRSSTLSGNSAGTIVCEKSDGSLGTCSTSITGVVCGSCL